MKKAILIFLALMMIATLGAAWATSADTCKYITAEDLNTRLGMGSPMILIDICSVEQFANGIEADRILILENGLDKWPFQTVAK
jgi:hypothetical protein